MNPAPADLALVASRVGVEEKMIMSALDRRGVRYRHVDPRRLWRFADESGPEYRVALNREIGYARAVHAARTLQAAGVRVLNSADATEACGDKWRSTLAFRAAGLPVPRTALALAPEAALSAIEAMGYPAVIKPLVGSWGRRVSLVPDRQTAETLIEYVSALPSPQAHLVYVQEFVPNRDRDIRVVVVGGEVIGATYRCRRGWRTNVALGGRSEYCAVTAQLAKLALGAAEAVGADIAGVDLIEGGAEGYLVIEVNHRVEFAGLQCAMGDRVHVASRIADFLLPEAKGRYRP